MIWKVTQHTPSPYFASIPCEAYPDIEASEIHTNEIFGVRLSHQSVIFNLFVIDVELHYHVTRMYVFHQFQILNLFVNKQ